MSRQPKAGRNVGKKTARIVIPAKGTKPMVIHPSHRSAFSVFPGDAESPIKDRHDLISHVLVALQSHRKARSKSNPQVCDSTKY
jgi:hypothetical protein